MNVGLLEIINGVEYLAETKQDGIEHLVKEFDDKKLTRNEIRILLIRTHNIGVRHGMPQAG